MIMNSVTTRQSVVLFSLWIGLALGLLAVAAHAQTATLEQPLRRYGMTSETDAKAMLQSMGIDPADTVAALKRARELGIPEDEIAKALGMAGKVADPKNTPTPPEQNQQIVETRTDTVPPPPPHAEPVPADGDWQGLTYFGYDIFRAGKDRVSPLEVGPVDPGYVIGTGDLLKLTLWGDIEYQYQLEVSQEGNILVPEAGQIFVSGTRLDDLRSNLINYLSKFYSGLAANPPTVFLDVAIARIHGNQIYIMGEVDHPGAYTISSYATSFNAMYAIGGPLVTGSLRDVRILRGGGIEAHIDLYDYLVKGTSTDDKRLQNNDIVFVPPRGKTIGIKGEVNRPGVYELLATETVQDLIRYAGRLKPTAYTFRAQIERIKPVARRTRGEMDREVVDLNLEDPSSDWSLVDGDLVEIFPISDRLQNYVELVGGGVFREGRYQLDNISTVAQLITAADGLTPYAVQDRAEIVRTRADFTREFMSFNLAAALAGDPAANLALRHMDTVRIFSKHDLIDAPMVILSGHAKRPGIYPLPDNLSLYALLFSYAGLQDSMWRAQTFMPRGDIFRLDPDGRTHRVIRFDLDSVWTRQPGADVALCSKDEIVLYTATLATLSERWVQINGCIKKPGRYEWKSNMTLSDLLREAGGFTEGAMYLEAEVARIAASGLKGDSLAEIIHVPIVDGDLRRNDPDATISAILTDATDGGRFVLQPNDQVAIRFNPKFEKPGTVQIMGQVMYPGSYILKKRNETLLELLERCGGMTNVAYAPGGQFYRNHRRLFLDFHALLEHGDSRENMTLQSSDSIFIPPAPNTVLITGEVMNPGYYKYLRGASTRDYLLMAGGRTIMAGRVLLQQPSGRTYINSRWRDRKPLDGAMIQVLAKPPEREHKPTDWSLIIKDSFAITASATTIIVLASQLNK